MAKTRDYLDYLDESVEIAPANSQEEYQAAETIAELMRDHGLEPSIEEFAARPMGKLAPHVLCMVMLMCVVGSGLTHDAIHWILLLLAALCAGLYLFNHFVSDIFGNMGPTAKSQNVVAVHKADGQNVVRGARPIVIVAHYDTPRVGLLWREPFAGYRAGLIRGSVFCVMAVVVTLVLQALAFIPEVARTFFWVVGILASLPPFVLGLFTILEIRGACSSGSNDNKSSIAAMMAILNKVRPGEDRATDADRPRKSRKRVGDEPEQVMPTSQRREVVEEVKGVRHGRDVLLGLGILPPSCEVVYEEPKVRIVEEIVAPEPAAVEPEHTEESVLDREDVEQPAAQDGDEMDLVGEEETTTSDITEEPESAGDLDNSEDEEPAEEEDETAEEWDGETYDDDYDADDDANDSAVAVEYDEAPKLPTTAEDEEESLEDEFEDEYDDEFEDNEYADDEFEDDEFDDEGYESTAMGSWFSDRIASIKSFFSRHKMGDDMVIERGENQLEEEEYLDDEDDWVDEEYEDDSQDDDFDDDEWDEDEDTFEDDAAGEQEESYESEYEEVSIKPKSWNDDESWQRDVPNVDAEALGEEDGYDDELDSDYDEYDYEDESEDDARERDADNRAVTTTVDDAPDAPKVDEVPESPKPRDPVREYLDLNNIEGEIISYEEYEEIVYVDEEEEVFEDEIEVIYEDQEADQEPVEDEDEAYGDDAYEEELVDDSADVYDYDDSYDVGDAFEDDDAYANADAYDPAEDDEYYDEYEAAEPSDADGQIWDEQEEILDYDQQDYGQQDYDDGAYEDQEYEGEYDEEYLEDMETEDPYGAAESAVSPSIGQRIKGAFRKMRGGHQQNTFVEDGSQDWEQQPQEYSYADTDQREDGYLVDEENMEGAYLNDDEYVEEELVEEYGDDEYYDDGFENESQAYDQQEQVGRSEVYERPVDPNLLHFDREEDVDILPRDTTGLDTIIESYDVLEYRGERQVRQAPEPVNDPTWGTTSYQPARPVMNIARRAALFDLPDPSSAHVDPLGSDYEDYDEYEDVEETPVVEVVKTVEQPKADSTPTSNESEADEQTSFWGDGSNASSQWKGGATMRSDLRDQDSDEPLVIDEEDLQDAMLELGDEFLMAHDIWFVATGASSLDHAGIKAFVEAHKRDVRGSFVINLESVGAGALTVLTQEGLRNPRKADRRLVRMLTDIAQDLHISLDSLAYNWDETESASTMRSRLRSVSIMGLDDNNLPAYSHTLNDMPENVDPSQVSSVVRLVTELIRRS